MTTAEDAMFASLVAHHCLKARNLDLRGQGHVVVANSKAYERLAAYEKRIGMSAYHSKTLTEAGLENRLGPHGIPIIKRDDAGPEFTVCLHPGHRPLSYPKAPTKETAP